MIDSLVSHTMEIPRVFLVTLSGAIRMSTFSPRGITVLELMPPIGAVSTCSGLDNCIQLLLLVEGLPFFQLHND